MQAQNPAVVGILQLGCACLGKVNRRHIALERKDETMAERANCVIALRSEGVSLLLDISSGTSKAQLHRARMMLRKYLK